MHESKTVILFHFFRMLTKNPIQLTSFLSRSWFHQLRSIVKNSYQIENLTDSEKASLWEKHVQSIIENNKSFCFKRHGLSVPLIVSLTSYSLRFKKLHLTLKCLLNQSIEPDKIILWISYDDKEK